MFIPAAHYVRMGMQLISEDAVRVFGFVTSEGVSATRMVKDGASVAGDLLQGTWRRIQ